MPQLWKAWLATTDEWQCLQLVCGRVSKKAKGHVASERPSSALEVARDGSGAPPCLVLMHVRLASRGSRHRPSPQALCPHHTTFCHRSRSLSVPPCEDTSCQARL